MPGDISRSYKGPKDGRVPSWMDDPSPSTLPWPSNPIDTKPRCDQVDEKGNVSTMANPWDNLDRIIDALEKAGCCKDGYIHAPEDVVANAIRDWLRLSLGPADPMDIAETIYNAQVEHKPYPEVARDLQGRFYIFPKAP